MCIKRYNGIMANQYLSLGLFIMLLSFFLMLNSLSTFEEQKTSSVINSLSEAFLGQAPQEQSFATQSATDPGDFFRQGSALDQINALFSSTIPDVIMQKNRFSTVMYLRVRQSVFDAVILSDLKQKPENFTPKVGVDFEQRFAGVLAGLMDTGLTPPCQMDILLHVPQSPGELFKSDRSKVENLIASVGQYADILEKEGLDPKLLSAGLAKGEEGYVTLIFRRYTPMRLELKL